MLSTGTLFAGMLSLINQCSQTVTLFTGMLSTGTLSSGTLSTGTLFTGTLLQVHFYRYTFTGTLLQVHFPQVHFYRYTFHRYTFHRYTFHRYTFHRYTFTGTLSRGLRCFPRLRPILLACEFLPFCSVICHQVADHSWNVLCRCHVLSPVSTERGEEGKWPISLLHSGADHELSVVHNCCGNALNGGPKFLYGT